MTIETITPQGTVESSKQALVNDLKRVVGDAEDLLNNVAGATADEFTLARSKLEARLDQAKSRLLDARTAVSESARCTVDATDRYVRENPWTVLGIAAAAGIVIGAIVSRR